MLLLLLLSLSPLFGRKTLFLHVTDYRKTTYYTVGLIAPSISLSNLVKRSFILRYPLT